MQHTRGPWTVADDGTIEAKFFGRVGQLIGCCDADERLVAAAPTMLAALRDVLFILEHEGDNGVIAPAYRASILYAVRPAIAQAIGDA